MKSQKLQAHRGQVRFSVDAEPPCLNQNGMPARYKTCPTTHVGLDRDAGNRCRRQCVPKQPASVGQAGKFDVIFFGCSQKECRLVTRNWVQQPCSLEKTTFCLQPFLRQEHATSNSMGLGVNVHSASCGEGCTAARLRGPSESWLLRLTSVCACTPMALD